MDGGGIILQDQECLTFSLNSITDRFASTLLGVDLSSFNVDFRFSKKPDLNSPSNLGDGCPPPDKPGTNTLPRRLYGSVNSPVSPHLPTLDEIELGTRSTDVCSDHSHDCSSHSQTLDEIRIGAELTDVASVNLSANTDDIKMAAKSLVGTKPHQNCTPSIDNETPKLSQPVGEDLTQTYLLDPHESHMSQSTEGAILTIMGSDCDKSNQTPSIPSKPMSLNLVPPTESRLEFTDSDSDNSLPPPIFPPKHSAHMSVLTTNAHDSNPTQSLASAPNVVVPEPALNKKDCAKMIHTISVVLGKSYGSEKNKIKEVLENIVVGNRGVSIQETPKLSTTVCGLLDNKQGIMTPIALNVIVDLFNHQSIPPNSVRPHFFCHNTICCGICTLNDILLLNKYTQSLIVHVLNKDNHPTTSQWSKLDSKTYLLSTLHPEVDSSICLFDEMKRLSFSSLTTNTEQKLPSQVNKVCYQVSLSLSIILEKYITPTSIHHLFADYSPGPASFNKHDTHKPKHKRRPMVDSKRNSIKLPGRNSKKKVTKPQPIINTRTLSERIPLLADSKLVTTKELRALLFVLDIRYRSNMSKFRLRELVSGALSQNRFSDVVHRSESNVKRGKFIITDNPSTVREDIMGSKLKNPSVHINLYCKAANSDFNNCQKGALLCAKRIKVGRLDFSLMSMVGKVSKNFFKDLEESMNDKWSGPFLPKTIRPSFIESRLGSKCLVGVSTEIYGFSVTIIQSEYIRSATDKIEKPRFEIDSWTFYNNVDLYEYKQGLAIVDKCVLRLGTSIKGDQRLEITLPQAEKILMLLVIGSLHKKNRRKLSDSRHIDQFDSTLIRYTQERHQSETPSSSIEAHCIGHANSNISIQESLTRKIPFSSTLQPRAYTPCDTNFNNRNDNDFRKQQQQQPSYCLLQTRPYDQFFAADANANTIADSDNVFADNIVLQLTSLDYSRDIQFSLTRAQRDAMPIHQSNMSDSNLKSLFPSFDTCTRPTCNTGSLIVAGATTWNRFICEIYEYGYLVGLEYQAQTGPRSISIKDQHTLTTFVDLINDIIPQAGCYWYDHNQYTRDAFLAFCHAANAAIPLAPLPPVTAQVPLASQPIVQATPCMTKPVLPPTSPPSPVLVTPPAPVSLPSPAYDHARETISTPVNNANLLGSPETHTFASTTDLPAYISTPTYTWTYFPSTESVRFRKVVSSTIPIVHPDTPPGDASHTTNRKRHSPRPSPKPSAISKWTFHPKSGTVTFHRSPKKFSSHKPSTSIPLLQLPPSGAFSKDSVVPSPGHAIIPSPGHAYRQHGVSTCPGRKPTYGAHSLTYDLPAVCITKRHRDAIKLKLYHLHATLLVANWTYDDILA
eukprot:jgi/Psemu1/44308/gm1.44308_g